MVNSGNADVNAVRLQHEAYRDGIIGSGQAGETLQAVIAHTVMADKMFKDGADFGGDANIARDLHEWYKASAGGSAFAEYALANYDSSGDYWKLTADGTLVKDKDGWLKDENGMYINRDGSRTWIRTENSIGADGIETGLLNILYGGTNNVIYSKFSDEQVASVQALMAYSGFKHSEGEMRDVSWKEGNDNAFIPFSNMINGGFGNSMAAAVFLSGYDRSTDMAIFGDDDGNSFIDAHVPSYVQQRYDNLYDAKSGFYSSISALVSGETSMADKGGYKQKVKGYYSNYNNLHFGIDIKPGEKDLGILSGISGTVIDSGYEVENTGYGNYVTIGYGYKFEDYTYNTGIYGEYAHMKNLPGVKTGQFVTAKTQLGLVGTTGKSTGDHLHYSVYTKPGQSYAANVMGNIFGKDYMNTAMTNNSNTKTVYDPTAFYFNYRNLY
jgi:murein DD-endopeptidase MepM/ murein hydrolase activator NlpD